MRLPMVLAFLLLTGFVLMFFIGSVQFEGTQSSVLQIIGFAGMVFSMSYSLLITHTAEEKEKQSEGY
ncbi:hypothetical protein [Salibacterium aidingense]|uniref:hypothetical protein n=1 Tax=Salibacterium aidingense TaxID=384933 RepID=UPI0004154FC7|nr:hypothetical protein [Salibacterium aidingense]